MMQEWLNKFLLIKVFGAFSIIITVISLLSTWILGLYKTQIIKGIPENSWFIYIVTENIIILLVTCFFIMIVLHFIIIKPLLSYKSAIYNINKEEFDFKLPLVSKDELGSIGKALNKMSNEIKITTNDLRNNNHILNEYKKAIDTSAIVIKSNFSGKITYVNEVFKEITGFTNEDIIGMSINTLRGQELSDENILEYWDSLLNCVVWKEVLNNKTKDGKDYYVNVTVSPVIDYSGEIVEYIDIWHDVTEIFQLKEELQHHKDNLETIVEKRTDELEIANQQLIKSEAEYKSLYNKSEETNKQLKQAQTTICQQEKMASIGHLAAGIAHELNNPIGFVSSNFSTTKLYLGKIKTYLDFVQQSLNEIQKGGNTVCEEINKKKKQLKIDFILDDIEDIFNESDEGFGRVTSIVNNLRSFSRVDFEENMQSFNLNEGIQNTLIVARNETKYVSDVNVDFGDIPEIKAYGGEINQVLLNVIVNAAQAIEKQHRNEKGNISIITKSDGDNVICTITDDGPGIQQEHLTQIFDPFFTTKAPGEGTGLGLNISYDIIVNKHNGLMTADSTEKGSIFTITLPIKQNQEV